MIKGAADKSVFAYLKAGYNVKMLKSASDPSKSTFQDTSIATTSNININQVKIKKWLNDRLEMTSILQ